MSIRREHRLVYPIDWSQFSAVIRFNRAGRICACCGRLHGQRIFCLGGRWWVASASTWRDGEGAALSSARSMQDLESLRPTKVM